MPKARTLDVVLTPIVIDDVHPRTPGGFPAKAVGGERVPVSAPAGGRRSRPAGCARPVATARATAAGNRHRCSPGGDDRWTGSIAPAADRAARAGGRRLDRPLRHLAPRDRGEGGRRPGRRARAGGGSAHPRRPRRQGLGHARPRSACRPRPRASVATAARWRSGLAAAFTDDVVELAAGVPDARLSSSAAASALGRSAARRPRGLVRAVPAELRRVEGRHRAPAATSPTSASTSSTCRRSTPSAPPTARAGTTASPPVPTTPAARGRSAVSRRRPRRRRTPSSARSTTSTPSSTPPRTSASRSRSTTRCSAAPTTPGCATTRSGSPRRPDGSIRYAENPPKKYQDIHPIDFWPADEADRVALWEACRDVLEHWIGHGVRMFRVDNPHTKPLAFWDVGDRRRARPSPGRAVPGRGVHRRRR